MSNTINGRTPEEIKKGLEYYAETDLAKKLNACKQGLKYWYAEDVAADALAYIQQLERERNAAVADLMEHGMFCSLCMHEEKSIHEEPCVSCSKLSTANNHSNWQWRGVQEVE